MIQSKIIYWSMIILGISIGVLGFVFMITVWKNYYDTVIQYKQDVVVELERLGLTEKKLGCRVRKEDAVHVE